jgi:hypothetical protein
VVAEAEAEAVAAEEVVADDDGSGVKPSEDRTASISPAGHCFLLLRPLPCAPVLAFSAFFSLAAFVSASPLLFHVQSLHDTSVFR